jgi:hypothetical protein
MFGTAFLYVHAVVVFAGVPVVMSESDIHRGRQAIVQAAWQCD